jgi:K+-sensing histidine kinase KdpD
VQETENARKHLLEELSHDLRTPLTSLNTSAETLWDHWDEMPREEQREFVSVIRTELGYFLHLIEDLFFIAAIGEPRYKKTTERVDLVALAEAELRAREATSAQSGGPVLGWELAVDPAAREQAAVLGDPLLIRRLFKNALDNAARHASRRVRVALRPGDRMVEVGIEDDGRGISDEEIAGFGQRRQSRFGEGSQGASLGLGSVIMRTIVELHGGILSIRRRDSGPGSRLSFLLPRVPAG